jgi:hypothetical protein
VLRISAFMLVNSLPKQRTLIACRTVVERRNSDGEDHREDTFNPDDIEAGRQGHNCTSTSALLALYTSTSALLALSKSILQIQEMVDLFLYTS